MKNLFLYVFIIFSLFLNSCIKNNIGCFEFKIKNKSDSTIYYKIEIPYDYPEITSENNLNSKESKELQFYPDPKTTKWTRGCGGESLEDERGVFKYRISVYKKKDDELLFSKEYNLLYENKYIRQKFIWENNTITIK